LSDKKWRTGSTGGSSVKDPEIIRSEVKKMSGSPSPSPPSHPQFPLMHQPEISETPKGMIQNLMNQTPKNILNNTQYISTDSKLIELPNVLKYA